MKWIKVSEQLPLFMDEVIIHTVDGKVYAAEFSDSRIYEAKWLLASYGTVGGGEYLALEDVTHWMPLPSPPKR